MMIAVIYLKKYMISICIFAIIIDKLSYWQEFRLVILFEINKTQK